MVLVRVIFLKLEMEMVRRREPGSGVGLLGMPDCAVLFSWLVPFCVSLVSFLFLLSKKSWSAPLPDIPQVRAFLVSRKEPGPHQ